MASKKSAEGSRPHRVTKKLVRDRIPEIVAARGETERFEVIDQKDRLLMLREKLVEEMDELLCARTHADRLEELADLSEVLHAIARAHFISLSRIEQARMVKKKERGGFNKFIALVRVTP